MRTITTIQLHILFQDCSLRNLQKKIQRMLLDTEDFSVNQFTTCTIASSQMNDSKPMTMLILSKGFRKCVPAYSSNHGGRILKISTIQIQGCKLQETIDTSNGIGQENSIDSMFSSAAFRVHESDTGLDHIVSGSITPISHDNHAIHFKIQSDEFCIESQINCQTNTVDLRLSSAEGVDIDHVQGSAIVEDIPSSDTESVPETISKILELDRPQDEDHVVTCVIMSVRETNKSVLTLYHLSAGDIECTPKEKEDNWELETVRITNSELYSKIEDRCNQILLFGLDPELQQKWTDNNAIFVVMSHLPGADLTDFETINHSIPVNTVRDEETGKERKLFKFSHPKNEDICFDVLEPASPVKVTGQPNLSKSTSSFSLVGSTYHYLNDFLT